MVGSGVFNSTFDSEFDSIFDSVFDSMFNSVFNSIFDSVFDSIFDSVFDSIFDSILALPGKISIGSDLSTEGVIVIAPCIGTAVRAITIPTYFLPYRVLLRYYITFIPLLYCYGLAFTYCLYRYA